MIRAARESRRPLAASWARRHSARLCAPIPGGLERLQGGHGLLDGLEGQARLEGHVGRRDRQEAAVVEAAHQVLHRLDRLRREVRHLGLAHQVLLERGLGRHRVEEMLAPLGVRGGVGLGAAGVRHVVAPVVVDLAEDLELL